MSQVNSFEGRVGYVKDPDISALANAGTATLTLPETCAGRFIPTARDSSGNVIAIGAGGFTVAYNSSTRVLTFTNDTGGAFTGEIGAMVLN